jgi:hypothetical protein
MTEASLYAVRRKTFLLPTTKCSCLQEGHCWVLDNGEPNSRPFDPATPKSQFPRKAFLPDSTPSTLRMFRMFQGHKQHLNNVRLLKIPKSLGKEEQAGSLIVSTGRLHSLSSVSHNLFDCKAVTLWAAFTD